MPRTDPELNARLRAYLAVRPPREPGDPVADSPQRQALVAYLMAGPAAENAAKAMHRKVQHYLERDAAMLAFPDLVQVARVSLIEMADDFDPAHGKRFMQCAHHRMHQRLVAAVRKAFRGGRGSLENLDRRINAVSLDDEVEGCERPTTRGETVPGQADSPYLCFQKQSVKEAVAALPPRQRDAVVLHVLEGWTYEEIANALDCAISTAYGYCEKGKAALAIALSDYRDGFDAD